MGRFEKLVIIGVMAALACTKLIAHYRFGTAFDSALLGNVAWRLGNGLDSVSSITGFRYFATHASLIIFPLGLVFRVWPEAGLPFTYLLQTASLGLVGAGVLRVASAFDLPTSARRWLLVLTLLSPGAFFATRLDVHETTLGLGFLAMTLGSGLAVTPLRRMWWWPILAAACRIEMAAATIVVGLLLLTRRDSRRIGLFSALAGLLGLSFSLWFVFRAGTEAASVAAHFAHLGATPGEVIGAIFSRPLDVLAPLTEPVMLASVVLWLSPFGLVVPLVGWRYLAVALPMAGVAILGVWPPADNYPHHYWYGFLVAAPFAAAEALRVRPGLLNPFRLTGLVGVAIGWAFLLAAAPSLGVFGQPDPESKRQIVAYVSDRGPVGVSVPDNVAPHLVGRAELHLFPRPFLCSESAIGPFAWSGELPEYVLLAAADGQKVEADPVLGPILAGLYDSGQTLDRITVYHLDASAPADLECLKEGNS
jgi:hypothetical protein